MDGTLLYSAAEARKEAMAVHQGAVAELLPEVLMQVKAAAQDGKCALFYRTDPLEHFKEYKLEQALTGLGYGVMRMAPGLFWITW